MPRPTEKARKAQYKTVIGNELNLTKSLIKINNSKHLKNCENRPHNPKVVGSNPAPATIFSNIPPLVHWIMG